MKDPETVKHIFWPTNLPLSSIRIAVLASLALTSVLVYAADPPAAQNNPAQPSTTTLPRSDANGNPIRRAPTGHISNYDEAKVGAYTLPDPLKLQNGQPVRDADTWFKQRRPEILKLYETEIYGRVPDRVPKITFAVAETDTNAVCQGRRERDANSLVGKRIGYSG